MLEVIFNAAYDHYLKKDDAEMLSKKNETVRKILGLPELTDLSVDDALMDLCSTYEYRAYRSGFLAAVQCLNSLFCNELKNHNSRESESEFETMDSPMA